MNGGDLVSMIEAEGSIDEITSRKICYSLISAIAHLHVHSIAHRDIKAENILVSSSGDADDRVFKLGDFGFSKREATPNCLTTLCGSISYVAPEVLLKRPYGVKCDVWSSGVLAFVLLGGYQPFHGENEDEVKNRIVKGVFNFDGKYWSHISDAAKGFIEDILIADPDDRVESEDLMTHSWFSYSLSDTTSDKDEKPVFFMIGSQRSGSNWLRTMLDQREDLVGPHPPHVMREFMPLISKFGDLSQDENFSILVDHVCTFVERNQVSWNDKYGQRIVFCRQTVCDQAKASCDRLEKQEEGCLNNEELYLLSIFDGVMDFFANANGKELWLCKSMGMSAYHTSLLKFYGQRRLRYIYLVRDPRDVALSFMNTPVGDKHYYAIVKKWAKLQKQAMIILEDTPDIIYNIKYEELLEDKKNVVSGIYDFIGDRRFGGVKRQASVLNIAPVAESVNQAKCGQESFKAHTLSYQFKNLCRGESFVKEQMAKWKNPENGLKEDDLKIIESLAFDAMEYFDYEAAYVKDSSDVLQFDEAQQAEFARLNKVGIEEMNENLKKDNIADYNRRVHQAEVLKMDAKLLSKQWFIRASLMVTQKKKAIMQKLNDGEVIVDDTRYGILEGFGTFVCGAYSQKGYYPSNPMKENQDSFDISICDVDNDDDQEAQQHFFGVFDGHGVHGGRCSQLCKATISNIYEKHLSEGCTTNVALTKAHIETHQVLTQSATVDAELSGTTTVIASLTGNKLTVAYAGDSAAVIGSKSSKRAPMLLTNPHDLSRPDEVSRIESKGGLVMSPEDYDEIKGHLVKKSIESGKAKKTLPSLVEAEIEEDVDADPAPKPQPRPRRFSRRGSIEMLRKQLSKRFKRRNRRPAAIDESKHFHQSLSDLIKTVLPSSRKDSEDKSADNLNMSIRKVINNLPHKKAFFHRASNKDSSLLRIWSGTSVAKVPGCAFTRSLGDTVAHEIGVSEEPDFKQLDVKDDDVLVIASDGVTEYLDTGDIVRIASGFNDPADAAKALVKSSSELWAAKNDYCDDITAIVIFLSGDDADDGHPAVEHPVEEVQQVKKTTSNRRSSLLHRLARRVSLVAGNSTE